MAALCSEKVKVDRELTRVFVDLLFHDEEGIFKRHFYASVTQIQNAWRGQTDCLSLARVCDLVIVTSPHYNPQNTRKNLRLCRDSFNSCNSFSVTFTSLFASAALTVELPLKYRLALGSFPPLDFAFRITMWQSRTRGERERGGAGRRGNEANGAAITHRKRDTTRICHAIG